MCLNSVNAVRVSAWRNRSIHAKLELRLINGATIGIQGIHLRLSRPLQERSHHI